LESGGYPKGYGDQDLLLPFSFRACDGSRPLPGFESRVYELDLKLRTFLRGERRE